MVLPLHIVSKQERVDRTPSLESFNSFGSDQPKQTLPKELGTLRQMAHPRWSWKASPSRWNWALCVALAVRHSIVWEPKPSARAFGHWSLQRRREGPKLPKGVGRFLRGPLTQIERQDRQRPLWTIPQGPRKAVHHFCRIKRNLAQFQVGHVARPQTAPQSLHF
jgi:hypothetical protein